MTVNQQEPCRVCGSEVHIVAAPLEASGNADAESAPRPRMPVHQRFLPHQRPQRRQPGGQTDASAELEAAQASRASSPRITRRLVEAYTRSPDPSSTVPERLAPLSPARSRSCR